mmetsp:Transcript_20589/g.60136  ORF Transcript_20589/g.60136 Transcript_20589/m.60136 type:complete len:217 (-) Transcript_20589:79-729(-)
MVRDLVLGDVVEGVLKGPVGDGVHLGQATADGRVLEQVDVGPLEALPPSPAVDHHVGLESLESTLKWLNLADLVVLLNVLLPQVRAELLVVHGLVRAALGLEHLSLEAVELFDLLQELHGLGKEVEGVDHHDLGLARLEVPEAVEQVSDHAVTSNHRVGEDRVLMVLHGQLEGVHGLLLQVRQAHVLGLLDRGFHVEARIETRSPSDRVAPGRGPG